MICVPYGAKIYSKSLVNVTVEKQKISIDRIYTNFPNKYLYSIYLGNDNGSFVSTKSIGFFRYRMGQNRRRLIYKWYHSHPCVDWSNIGCQSNFLLYILYIYDMIYKWFFYSYTKKRFAVSYINLKKCSQCTEMDIHEKIFLRHSPPQPIAPYTHPWLIDEDTNDIRCD